MGRFSFIKKISNVWINTYPGFVEKSIFSSSSIMTLCIVLRSSWKCNICRRMSNHFCSNQLIDSNMTYNDIGYLASTQVVPGLCK